MKRLPTGTGAAGLPEVTSRLTARDMEILAHLAARRSTTQIAAAMSITGNTVRTRVRRLVRKLAVTERDRVVQRAQALSLV